MRALLIALFLFVLILISYLVPPGDFPDGEVVLSIEPGLSVSQIYTVLSDAEVIRNKLMFRALVQISGKSGTLDDGRYKFAEPETVLKIVDRLAVGDFGTEVRRITIPEGITNMDISELMGVHLGDMDQGYLFPDTYYFDEYATADEVRMTMRTNFDSKVDNVVTDTIIVASILEKEVRGEEDMRLVAGILYKREKAGMPLQVDSYPESYKVVGFPKLPISNPGLVAIRSAENPQESKYWYYISGKDGKTHYAVTFEGHKANVRRYL